MMHSKPEALSAARKLVRTFASAPDPRRQARLVYTTLLQWSPWPAPLQNRLDSFGLWLESFPPVGELRARSANLLVPFPSGRPSPDRSCAGNPKAAHPPGRLD